MKGKFEKQIKEMSVGSPNTVKVNFYHTTALIRKKVMLEIVDEARKDLPEIIIRKDGLVILRDDDYDHDILLGRMNLEASKNVEEARKSLKKFEKWFGGETENEC